MNLKDFISLISTSDEDLQEWNKKAKDISYSPDYSYRIIMDIPH